MRLVYNASTRTTENSPGVEIRIPGFGNSTVVEYLDPSKLSVGTYFQQIGKRIKINIHIKNTFFHLFYVMYSTRVFDSHRL